MSIEYFPGLAVGDSVIVMNGWREVGRIEKVSKVMKTQFLTEKGQRFSRTSQYEVGSYQSSYSPRAKLATPEALAVRDRKAQYEADQAEQRHLLNSLKADMNFIPLPLMRHIRALIDDVQVPS